MIIWINGAFGAGKTQTSFELQRRLPHSIVFDPENAGYYIRKNIPRELSKGDFQDYTMWREMNYSMLKYMDTEYRGIIIVPMTIVNPQYFSEIVGKLREDGVTVHHFTLCASKEVLLKRLLTRGEGKNSWAAQQIDRCIAGLSNEVFRHHLDTENLTVGMVSESIASMLHIPLQPDQRGRIEKLKDRVLTQIKHIRFFT
ncbi:AAA family ATPase [Brevibacillus ruminantium]|uniref:AAA family ATPase n=1 Tax=Brevibacillus ruminantium TaxID=2950604 RepID=A0ABY4WNR5_9BACL|nr:AAA family ATPase [Brevibacillus ruminantium]USG68401.1 AAA family ATPase [Brevibacillus ruminantium]